MPMPDVLSRVTELVGLVTDQPAGAISVGDRFDALANWTSFAALRLLAGVESDFGVRLDLREYLAIRDVGGLVDAISAGLSAPGRRP